MSAVPPLRELIAFDGVVECRREQGAINLTLRGSELRSAPPAGRIAAEVLFAAATLDATAGSDAAAPGLAALPAQLHDVRLLTASAAEAPSTRRILLSARELQLELSAHSVQLHRDAARAFFGAVPPARVPLPRRLGWALLLLALKLPGAERVLAQLRGGH